MLVGSTFFINTSAASFVIDKLGLLLLVILLDKSTTKVISTGAPLVTCFPCTPNVISNNGFPLLSVSFLSVAVFVKLISSAVPVVSALFSSSVSPGAAVV